jgi:hypothetical protein
MLHDQLSVYGDEGLKRRVARMHGTPIYVWENGKEVAIKP